MHIDVECFNGPLSSARRALGRQIALETFGSFRGAIDSVRFDVPKVDDRGPTKRCGIHVKVRDGRTLECEASAANVADAIERAAHDMRLRVAAELSDSFDQRTRAEAANPRAERRSASSPAEVPHTR
ncbi:hypothetical protein BH09MYX1_BH09MYX1_06200 [soil metagenome]